MILKKSCSQNLQTVILTYGRSDGRWCPFRFSRTSSLHDDDVSEEPLIFILFFKYFFEKFAILQN
jgi:hypothetical protein